MTTGLLLCSLETILINVIDDPDFVKEVFKLSNEYFMVAIRRMIDSNVDAICIAEDLGIKNGPFMSLKLFQELLFPYLEELFNLARHNNMPTFLHSCRNIDPILQEVAALGMDGIHPIQRARE